MIPSVLSSHGDGSQRVKMLLSIHCFSPSFDAHLTDLQAVFDRFRLANLKLKATKCKVFQERCKFLGYIVSANGLEADESKIACITGWPFPKTISELRGFLGLCSYYRSFCPGFATIADPLTECLRKGVKLCNTPRRQEAFDRLKTNADIRSSFGRAT